jgi:adenosylcobalamin-dependent ribonucleoside-triphosphate reductase
MFSFRLKDDFIAPYSTREVNWGYTDAAGNSLGEITFLRTYSRLKDDGTKERWHEVCRRVVEGTYSIQKDHAKTNRLPWSDHKAQRSAQEMYERLFTFKWTPPGRGLWMMGSPLVMRDRNSAALQNCAFISTADMTKTNPTWPFAFLMEASMLGIGVGFDTKGAEKRFRIFEPIGEPERFEIPDTREGWVESVVKLLESHLMSDRRPVTFYYDMIRPAGWPIKTFGGTAAGPGPLVQLHHSLRRILAERDGQVLTDVDITDIANLIGKCVVSGNVRRSAELAIGSLDSDEFLQLKNASVFPERNHYCSDKVPCAYEMCGERCPGDGWGWMSNNSVFAEVGTDLSSIAEGIALNGEPGVIWIDMARQYGRLIDPPDNKDHRVAGFNPCAEQSLESGECCTLVETYLGRHSDLEDFKRTLKFAYLYAKTVTLLPTHWPQTNAIMQRNRRIGCSISGVANFADRRGMTSLRTWMNEGYSTVQHYDRTYSEWLCVRESIKTTTVKPSGTVSILAGESPGVHWTPGGEFFDRALRFSSDDPMVQLFRDSGYRVEVDIANPLTTVVVYFPIASNSKPSEKDVSLFEKANLAVLAQRYWSDNSVSVTLSFNAETEKEHVGTVLHMHEGQLKTVSFLPYFPTSTAYEQMPYTEISHKEWSNAAQSLSKVDLTPIYDGGAIDGVGESYCTTDACEIKGVKLGLGA